MRRLTEIAGTNRPEESFTVGTPEDMKWFCKARKRVHIFALGDVGSTLLTGCRLLGGDCISELGLYDVRPGVCERWEFEMNQVRTPGGDFLPQAIICTEENLFDCDVFLFCASRRVPELSERGDVRMAQLSVNAPLVTDCAKKAIAAGFTGLFGVVSDPVDPLCKAAVLAGLPPARVKGFGLGVMAARAAYYAEKEEKYSRYLTEGRAFGPHGEDLVIADSLTDYDDGLSRELTEKAVRANRVMREWGYKPYVAPALSSGALSVLAVLRGDWNYSSVWMDGVFFGVRNRMTKDGIEAENPLLPDALFARCQKAYENLKVIL